MGLITDYETIKSRAYYFINFKINDVEFHHHGIGSPLQTLAVVRTLQEKGITPIELSRKIVYDYTKSGYRTKDPEEEDITIARLEEIVEKDEVLPEIQVPKVLSTYRC